MRGFLRVASWEFIPLHFCILSSSSNLLMVELDSGTDFQLKPVRAWHSSARGAELWEGAWQMPRDHLPAPRAGNPSGSGLAAVLGRLRSPDGVIAGARS